MAEKRGQVRQADGAVAAGQIGGEAIAGTWGRAEVAQQDREVGDADRAAAINIYETFLVCSTKARSLSRGRPVA